MAINVNKLSKRDLIARSGAHGIGAILSRLIREPPRTDNFSFLFQLASEKRVRRVTLSPLQFVQSRCPDLISQRFRMVLLFRFLLTSGVYYYPTHLQITDTRRVFQKFYRT